MLIEPNDLEHNWIRLEEIEKSSLRLVVQALFNYRDEAEEIFRREDDLVSDIGEDVTREALDRLGMSRIDHRLFGKVDYKRARYIFHPDYAVRQALFVDSKAENIQGQGTATLQISQISMMVRQLRQSRGIEPVEISGRLPRVIQANEETYITTTVVVKYSYQDIDGRHLLKRITIAAVPNGYLQQRYNPDHSDSIWLAGRDAPRLNEEFRVRLSFRKLKHKANWRVQFIPVGLAPFIWDE